LTLLLRVLEAVIARLPFRAAQRVGAALGAVVHHLLPIRRGEVRRRIGERLGLGPLDARRVARDCYRHLGTSALEFLWLAGRAPAALAPWIRHRGLEHFEGARAAGRGVVVATAHTGNWDLCACAEALRLGPLDVVTKSLRARGLDRYWMERRRQRAVRLHPARGSLAALVRSLRGGGVVALVIDQRADDGGVALPFLGAPAATSLAAATLAARTGAALVPVFSRRAADGSHVVDIEPSVVIDRALPVSDAIVAATRACNEALERAIRRAPEQWLWLHRRWDDPRRRDCTRRRATV
jgi:KDO2-lipid IV(A) lauroyltransferase